jgi:glyoxylase-like metal-dependent hydrolase (beta-lactamase superfamily II)
MSLSRRDLLAAGAALGATTVLAALDRATAATEGALKLQLFTSDDNGFLVNSVILTGEKDAIAVDAQFSMANAHRLVAELLSTGKRLTTVYVTHPHPDHYFGLEVVKAAFPDAKIVAIPPVAAAIEVAVAKKIAQWGPRLGANGPSKVVLPTPLAGNALELEGHKIEIIGPVQGDAFNNTMLWVPALKALVAGDTVYSGTHVWTASADKAERAEWLKTLVRIEAFKPEVVVPGHIKPGTPLTLAAVAHTRGYLEAFDQVVASTGKADEIVKAMTAKYPNADLGFMLDLGAKVAAGDIPKWD